MNKHIAFLLFLSLGAGCTQTVVEDQEQTESEETSAETTTTNVPTFVEQTATFHVENAPIWLFAVDDETDSPVLSTERDGAIYLGHLDLANPATAVEWQRVVSSDDLGGKRVADHWHTFAYGAHWIVFSVQEANASYLLKLDQNFERLSLTPVATTAPTNDMFLVENDAGVSVGHFMPGVGHTLYDIDLNGNVLHKSNVGGDRARHGNGASAIGSVEGFSLFAGETLNFVEQSALLKIDTDLDWNVTDVTTLVDDPSHNVSMTSAVMLEGGYVVVTARVTESYERGVLPPPKDSGEPLADDGGSIVRFVFDEEGNEISREVLFDGTTEHRPHMELIGELLITTWDGAGGSSLRIDEVVY